MLDPRLLSYFVVVAEELHFTRAANRVGITQSRMSQKIKALERQLGARLFWRDNRNVRLSDAGLVLLGAARTAIAHDEATRLRVQMADAGLVGRLRIGAVPSAIIHPVPGHIRSFEEKMPAVTIDVQEATTGSLLAALNDDEVDVAYVCAVNPRATSFLVSRERFMVVLPADHPLARRREVPLALLDGEAFVTFGYESVGDFRDETWAAFRRARLTPRVVHRVGSSMAVIGMVAAGRGFGVLVEAHRSLGEPATAFRPSPELKVTVPLFLARLTASPSPLVRGYVDHVRSLAEDSGRPAPAARANRSPPAR